METMRDSRLAIKDTDKGSANSQAAEFREYKQASWVTGFWKRLPYLGVAALVAILLRE
jgi:hypothetical protein